MVLAAIALVIPNCSHKESSAQVTAPAVDAPCTERLAGALTRLADNTTTLQCRAEPGGHLWKLFADPYPTSDRWVSYDSALSLSGQGKRNPEMMSGDWVGYPLDTTTRCRSEQTAVVSAGKVGPLQVEQGEPGKPLEFEVLPVMFGIELIGNCLWQKMG